jgi:hypothetical protein
MTLGDVWTALNYPQITQITQITQNWKKTNET